jgi:hypothetical protein
LPALFVTVLLGSATAIAASTETQFLAENNAAMGKMMADMHVEPSGDVDADFVTMMVAHHQGAIDMAQSELRYGRNEQLRAIADEIIVKQRQQIAAMRMALGPAASPSVLPSNEGSSPSDEIDEEVTPRGIRMLQEP